MGGPWQGVPDLQGRPCRLPPKRIPAVRLGSRSGTSPTGSENQTLCPTLAYATPSYF